MGSSDERHALTISVSEVVSAQDRGRERRYRALKYADARSDALAATLENGFGYRVEPSRAPSGRAIDEALEGIMGRSADCRVIHLIAHGTDAQNDLHLVGSDGHHSRPINMWTREPSEIMLAEDPLQAIPTLFIVDSCSAGTAILEQLFHRAVGGITHRWVVAAADDGTASYDGRLTAAVDRVGERIGQGALDIAPDFPHIPYMQFLRELRAEVAILSAGGPGQVVRATPVERDDPGTFPFFANPNYVELTDGSSPQELGSFLESLAFDAKHWRTRAAGRAAGEDDGGDEYGAFAGRAPELCTLNAFVHGEVPERLLVVTGSPGAGKSALLALLVCNTHDALSESTRGLWQAQSDMLPGPVEPVAAVHARQLTMAEVVDALHNQLGLPASNGPEELIAQIEAMPEPPLVIIDALDEASVTSGAAVVGSELLDGLLLPLIDSTRPDGMPSARLILGTRRWVAGVPLVEHIANRAIVVDLDEVPPERLRRELERYSLLRLAGAKNAWDPVGNARVAHALAERLTAASHHETKGHLDGHFLAASVFLSGLLNEGTNVDEAVSRAQKAPARVSELLELELSRHPDREALLGLLRAVALAKGNGAPLGVLAQLHRFTADDDSPIDEERARELLIGPLSFYLRTASDTDGSVLYRLFHQGLVDQLQDMSALDHRAILRLVGGSEPAWDQQRSYVLRHIIEHASDIDSRENRIRTSVVSWLWEQPGFLLACNPATARGFAPPIASAGFEWWELFSSTKFGSDASRSERARQLAMQAVRWDDKKLTGQLRAYVSESVLWPVWGTSRTLPRARSDERHPATSMPFSFDDGSGVTFRGYTREGQERIVGTFSGEVWAAAGEEALRYPLWEHPSGVTAVAVSPNGKRFASASLDGQIVAHTMVSTSTHVVTKSTHVVTNLGRGPTALLVGDLGEVVVGLSTGVVEVLAVRSEAEPGERIEFNNVATLELSGRGRVSALGRYRDGDMLVAFQNHTLVRWSPTEDTTRELMLSPTPITSMALTRDERLLVCGCSDGTVRRWDITSGAVVGSPLFADEFAILAVRILSDGVTIEAFAETGASSTWDLFKGARTGFEAEESSAPLRAVMSLEAHDRVVSGSTRGLQTYASSTGRQTLGTLAEHPITGFVVDGFEDSVERPRPGWSYPNRRLDWLAQRKYNPEVRALVETSNGIVVAEADGRVSGWEVVRKDKQEVWAPRWKAEADDRVEQLVSLGRAVAGLMEDGAIAVWDAQTGAPLAVAPELREPEPHRTTLAADASRLFIGHHDGRTAAWELGGDRPPTLITSVSGPVTALNPASQALLVGTGTGVVQAHRWAGGTWEARLEASVVGVFETQIRLGHRTEVAVVTVSSEGAVSLLGAGTGLRLTDDFENAGACVAAAYDARRRLLTLAGESGLLTLRIGNDD
ncbi:caspase family protein [Mycetocola sp. 2940]|uniref:caspase family protein n=1 Tax=Mycetocola sp. 2940 TaxID=3156452 RepID=UPI003398E07E